MFGNMGNGYEGDTMYQVLQVIFTPCPLLNDTKIFLFLFVFLELNDTRRVGKVIARVFHFINSLY